MDDKPRNGSRGGQGRDRGRGRGRGRSRNPGTDDRKPGSAIEPEIQGKSTNYSNRAGSWSRGKQHHYRGNSRSRQNGRDFDVSTIEIHSKMPVQPTPEITAILDELKGIRRQEDKSAQFTETIITKYYQPAGNPYALGLTLAFFSHDVAAKVPHSMACTVLSALRSWLDDKGPRGGALIKKDFNNLVTLEMQDSAFVLATSHHGYFLDNLNAIFNLDKVPSLGRYVPSIRKLMFDDKIHLAIKCVLSLHLDPFLQLAREIIFPAMLCGQMKLGEELIEKFPDQIQPLANLMNKSLCIRYNDWEFFIAQYNVPKSREVRFQVKDNLGKKLHKLKQKHNLSNDVTCNIPQWQVEVRNNQIRSVLIYLSAKRSRGEMSEVQWSEAIDFILRQCPPDLRKFFLIHLITKRRDLAEAAKWTVRMGIDPMSFDCPPEVRAFLRDNQHIDASFPAPEPYQPLDGCLVLPSTCSIEFVSSETSLIKLGSLLESLAKEDLVGLDVEWMPWDFGFPSKPKGILAQLALRDSVYLIDLNEETRSYTPETWASFVHSLFSSSCKKFGWDFHGDLIYLRSAFPTVPITLTAASGMYCLSSLVVQLWHKDTSFIVLPDKPKQTDKKHAGKNSEGAKSSNSTDNTTMESQKMNSNAETGDGTGENSEEPEPPKVHQIGLSTACKYFLGKELDKREQTSHWGRRPLRDPQIHYAALDAYSIISLYDEVKRRAAEAGLDFDTIEQSSLITSA